MRILTIFPIPVGKLFVSLPLPPFVALNYENEIHHAMKIMMKYHLRMTRVIKLGILKNFVGKSIVFVRLMPIMRVFKFSKPLLIMFEPKPFSVFSNLLNRGISVTKPCQQLNAFRNYVRKIQWEHT